MAQVFACKCNGISGIPVSFEKICRIALFLVFFLKFATKSNAMDDNKYIRFDWAAKRMLRDKANFGVFEGLITVLLNEPVHIVEILESESNQNDVDDKFNRVDIKARNSKDEIILVEIQQARELYYLERALWCC